MMGVVVVEDAEEEEKAAGEDEGAQGRERKRERRSGVSLFMLGVRVVGSPPFLPRNLS